MNQRVARGVDRVGQCVGPAPPEFLHLLGERAVQIAPLDQAQIGHEVRAAAFDQPAMAEALGERVGQELPQRKQAEEIRTLVAKAQVRLIGRLLLFQRPFARIGNRQRAGNDQHLGKATVVARGENHAPDARVDRQLRELATEGGEFAPRVDGRELVQQLVAVGNGAGAGRLEKRKRRRLAQVERGHAQDDRCQGRAQDLGVGEARSGLEILLAIEPHAHARRDPAAATGPLLRGRLRDFLDLQQRHLVAQRIAAHPRHARIDDVVDARHGERRLGDVGREHDAPAAARSEHALLFGDRQPGVERQHLDVACIRPAGEASAQQVGRFADLALAGEEDQDVARAGAPQVFRGGDDPLLERLLVVALVTGQRPVAQLHRIGAPRDLDHRGGPIGTAEVPGEALGIERRRGDEELQVRAPGQQLLQVSQQKIDVEAALVRFVEDDRVVRGEQPVALRFGEQDAVGHHFDVGVRAGAIGEADLEADGAAQRHGELLRQARGDAARGDAARLGVADQAAHAALQLQADLRQLGGLAGTGRTADDHHRMRADRLRDVVTPLAYRQFGRVADPRHRRGAGAGARAGRSHGTGHGLDLGARDAAPLQAVDALPEPRLVGRHGGGELGAQAVGEGVRSHRASLSGRILAQRRHRPGSAGAPRRYHEHGSPREEYDHGASARACFLARRARRRRRRRRDAALGQPRRLADDRSVFAERGPHQQHQPARL